MVTPFVVKLRAEDKKHIVCDEDYKAKVSLAIEWFIIVAVDLEVISNRIRRMMQQEKRKAKAVKRRT